MPNSEEIRAAVKKYILENLLDENSADELTDSTPLVTGGILDSISILQFVTFLEETFGILFEPQEVDQDNLNTIDRIINFVELKMKSK